MTPLEVAQGHVAKAREFLAEAETALRNSHPNAATSNAVIAGINANDAICLVLVGTTSRAADHSQAVPELRRAGKAGALLTLTLDRLLNRGRSRSTNRSRCRPRTPKPQSVRPASLSPRQRSLWRESAAQGHEWPPAGRDADDRLARQLVPTLRRSGRSSTSGKRAEQEPAARAPTETREQGPVTKIGAS